MIYLDHAASTPCDPRVVEAMLPWFTTQHANASSPHLAGKAARTAIDRARQQIATALDIRAHRVIFTSGATEALNEAYDLAAHLTPRGTRVLTATTEHKASLEAAARTAQRLGRTAIDLPVGADGTIDLSGADFQIDDIIAVMAVNNETGTCADPADLTSRARQGSARTIIDVSQALGKMPVGGAAWGLDISVASGHKVGGPQGVGVLITPEDGVDNWPGLLIGGGQERGLRAGTLNVPGIIGFGAAAELISSELATRVEQVAAVRAAFLAAVTACVPDVEVNGTFGVPHILNLWVPGIDNSILLARCADVAFATGSACNSAVPEPSHVLTQTGYSADRARESIRVSFSHTTTAEEASQAAAILVASIDYVRDAESR